MIFCIRGKNWGILFSCWNGGACNLQKMHVIKKIVIWQKIKENQLQSHNADARAVDTNTL